eukprot:snap_masked-scaffold_29-processed-gene-2.36-mRNA-1 protein AED:1.00 eAED:1.00 QI:0/0/0/0/1/1/3/0/85
MKCMHVHNFVHCGSTTKTGVLKSKKKKHGKYFLVRHTFLAMSTEAMLFTSYRKIEFLKVSRTSGNKNLTEELANFSLGKYSEENS